MQKMLIVYLSTLETNEDKRTFEELYLKHRQMMYSVTLSILHNEQDAEDAVHYAFVGIAKYFSKVKRIHSDYIKSYLVIVAKNAAINMYRKNTRKNTYEKELNDFKETVDYLERLEYEELIRIISTLPETSKEVLFLFFLDEFTVKEIAGMLNITQNAVLKRLGRAKKLLGEALEEEDGYAENKI